MTSLIGVKDVMCMGYRCGGEVGVCVPEVGLSALGLPELTFRLDRLLSPVSEFPVSLVYPVDVVFKPVVFESPLLVYAFKLEQLISIGFATLQYIHVTWLV